MNRTKAFTLIELLVVIAIIGILAGIIFPVFAQAKKSAYRSSDMSNMNSIRSALLLYRVDQGAYPPSLLGYVDSYSGTVATVPANSVVGALYPKRIDSVQTLRPSLLRGVAGGVLESEVTTAKWPGIGMHQAGKPTQRFGAGDPFLIADRSSGCSSVPAVFYRISGYDVARVGQVDELRYTRAWTGYTVPGDVCSPDPTTEMGSGSDDPRQLIYSEPPDTTVITWDSFFRDYDSNGNPQHIKQDIVLYLSGAARPTDSLDVATKAWQIQP